MLTWVQDTKHFSRDKEAYIAVAGRDGANNGEYYGVLFITGEYLAYHSEHLSWGRSYSSVDAAKQACEDHLIQQMTNRLMGDILA